ncbi:MAG: tetratricopeptide repeat protein [Myxococcales bacterium]|nr:tetratricopeptide repeat protein [Myxococcales bacterium]
MCLRFDAPFASVCLAAGSEARLTRDGGDRVVSLTRGAVVAALDSLPEGQGFRVDAPRSSTRAVGTVFAVVVEERGEQVAVLEGVVAVRRGDDEAFVRAGYGLSPESGVPAALAGDALPWIRAHAAMADLWRPGAVARLSVPEEIDATEVVIDGHGVTRGLAVLVSAGAHAIELSSSSGTERRSISVEAGERHELTPVERPRERPKARPVRAKQDSVEALRRRAREARAAGRWHEAATIYRELVDKHPDSPAAGNARVQLGDLLLRRLGAPGEALTHYDAYIARGGDLIVEAHHGRIRALRQLGRTDEEREAIGRFLSQYPGSLAAEQLRARARALDVEPQ